MTRTIQQLFDLTGKNALITGGSRGLGLQMAHALGEAGARVMLSSRKAGDLEEAVAELQAAGIDARWHRDLFVALGDDLGAGAWSVRLQYKPMVRFIWLGAAVMAFGGLLAITDRRYRVAVRESVAAEAAARNAG